MMKPWSVEQSTITYRDPWLTVRSDRCRVSDGRVIEPFHVLEYPGWINIVALTPEHDVIMVEQYRHGAQKILTELPAGTVEPSDCSPAAAAVRELQEETGYTTGAVYYLGSAYANPANQNNRVWSYLALDCVPAQAPSPDASEDLELKTEPFISLLQSVQRFDLQSFHALALFRAYFFILRSSDPCLAGLRAELAALTGNDPA